MVISSGNALNTNSVVPPRLLFVDDEDMVLRTLQFLFRHDGYDIRTACNGEEALTIMESEKIDVVISDERMPRMTGAELLRKVASVSPWTTRIMLTGYTDMTALESSVNDSGVFRFVSKPWNNDDLRATVREAIKTACVRQGRTENVVPFPETTYKEPVAESTSHALSILVVDDDPQTFSVVGSIGNLGEITPTSSVRVARSILNEKSFDVVISELQVNSRFTFVLLKNLLEASPDTKIIITSKIRDFDLLQKLINEVHIFRYYHKPIKRGMLRLAIESAVSVRTL